MAKSTYREAHNWVSVSTKFDNGVRVNLTTSFYKDKVTATTNIDREAFSLIAGAFGGLIAVIPEGQTVGDVMRQIAHVGKLSSDEVDFGHRLISDLR